MMKTATKFTKQFYNTEIPSDWSAPEFGDVFNFLKTYSFSREQLTSEPTRDKIRNIHYGDIHATYENEILDLDIEKTVPYLLDGIIDPNCFDDECFPALKEGDLIIADASEDYKGVCDCVELKNINGAKIVSGLHTFASRASEEIIALGYRTYALKHEQVIRELRRIATGTSVYGVSKTNLSKVKIPLPPLSEQQAIAGLLSTWDTAIHKTEKLIIQKELRKKWLMQQLLAGKKRLKGFGSEKFKKIGLDEVLIPVRIPLQPEVNHLYRQIGIRSHGKGIFYKEKITGKELGEKRVFWIQEDCLILNIVFAWEQAVAITTDAEVGMIASHRFPMYKPAEGKLNLEYILYFFKSPRGKQLLENASPGGAGRNKTLGQTEFLSQIVSLPTISEQTAIARVLQAADKEISLLKAKAEKLREQKKGLMQVLLTGKKRLKYDT